MNSPNAFPAVARDGIRALRALEDPRSGQRRHGPRRRVAVLVRRTRPGDAGLHPRGRRRSLAGGGETFYSHNLGLPELRGALADHAARARRVHSGPRGGDQFRCQRADTVFPGAASPGDRVVAVTPLWPNLVEAPKILSAHVETVGLDFDVKRGWTLDVERLLAALTPHPSAGRQFPNNPTGWSIAPDDARTLLAHCRRHGIWILSDDAYERIPAERQDRLRPDFSTSPTVTNAWCPPTRSPSWLMTGWRLGWITGPRALIEDIGKIIEYNTSCAPVFVQRAGVAAVTRVMR